MKRFPPTLSLRNKLLLSFFFLILLPISCCYTMASYNQITDIIREQMAYSSRQAIDQTAQLLSNRVENMYIEDESWYRRLTESGESSIWLPPSYNQQVSALKERVVSYIRLIHDNQDYSRILALLSIDLLESKITAVARGTVSTHGGAVFLQNADGEILASSNGQTAPDSAVGAMMTYTAEVPLSSWTLTSSIPHSHVSAIANQSKRELLFVMAFSTFLSRTTGISAPSI